MFDFGFSELALIVALAILLLGPKEIPVVMHTLGRIVRRMQYVRYAFSQQFEDFMRENDLNDIRQQVNFEQKHFDEAAADDEEEDLHLPDLPVLEAEAQDVAVEQAEKDKDDGS